MLLPPDANKAIMDMAVKLFNELHLPTSSIKPICGALFDAYFLGYKEGTEKVVADIERFLA